jgi:8-oxo-dGTP pyrophosphatase MutT (NUDIX family)
VVLDPYYVIEESDWVHVFAISADAMILTVRQFRYAAEVFCTELPGGIVDPGEAPLEAAKRELREETGFEAGDWQEVGSTFANPARQTNKVHIFVATNLTKGSPSLDQSEDIESSFMSVSEIEAAIKSGLFSQALHVAGFYMAMQCDRVIALLSPGKQGERRGF